MGAHLQAKLAEMSDEPWRDGEAEATEAEGADEGALGRGLGEAVKQEVKRAVVGTVEGVF